MYDYEFAGGTGVSLIRNRESATPVCALRGKFAQHDTGHGARCRLRSLRASLGARGNATMCSRLIGSGPALRAGRIRTAGPRS